jgi:hypothetical protein
LPGKARPAPRKGPNSRAGHAAQKIRPGDCHGRAISSRIEFSFRLENIAAIASGLSSPARFLLIALCLSPLLHAQGGPPFLTDDPGTPGDGHWEVNVAWTHESRSGESLSELPLLDINYGVGARIQLKYEASYLIAHPADSSRVEGPSNSLLGVKWRFYDDEKSGLTVSTYPQLELRNPGSHSAARGLVADESTLLLPVEIQKEAGGWGVNVEVGWLRPSKSNTGWIYGVVVGHELNERIEVGCELHGRGSAALNENELTANVGLRWKLNAHCSLLGSIGRELHNDFEARARVTSYLAVQLTR